MKERPLNKGWLKLTQADWNERPAVFVWAPDVEMVAVATGRHEIGSIVYLHHDKIRVTEEAEWIIRAVDEICREDES